MTVLLAGDPSATSRMQRLINFVVDDKNGLGMQYDESATYTVTQAYAARKANCLTFTLLVLAVAKEAGLEAYPQEIGETLSWRMVEGTIYRENHINAGVRIGGHRYSIDPRRRPDFPATAADARVARTPARALLQQCRRGPAAGGPRRCRAAGHGRGRVTRPHVRHALEQRGCDGAARR